MSYHLTPLAAACQRWKNATRRSLFRHGGLLAASGLLRAAPEPAGIYESLGVRPIINCQGDKTILGGSLILPEVRSAMEAASRRFVDLDELMEGVGARLAALTGAEWGIVTSGCASAIANATAACIAGGDPEKLQRIPDLEGLKNEVIIPRFCRNVYDHAVRMVGVRIVEVETREELQQALSARTAMIYLYFPRVPLELEVVVAAARPKNVPVFVDAAAEDLSIPNRYLQRGATLVGYSGGKALHGPQCAGILLGRKDLVRAAFLHSAPHHAFGRPMKVGKEEILGMLAAVEAWTKRDHEAEHRQWEAWLDHIAGEVGQVAGVTARKQRPYTPAARIQLEIRWDSARLGITGEEVGRLLAQGEPRIIVGAATAASLIIAPPMMVAGEEKLVAGRIRALLAHPPRRPRQGARRGPTGCHWRRVGGVPRIRERRCHPPPDLRAGRPRTARRPPRPVHQRGSPRLGGRQRNQLSQLPAHPEHLAPLPLHRHPQR